MMRMTLWDGLANMGLAESQSSPDSGVDFLTDKNIILSANFPANKRQKIRYD